MLVECIRCNRVSFAEDVAWLTATITCEDASETVALCSDCQRTLRWTARNLVTFAVRQTRAQMMVMTGGVQ